MIFSYMSIATHRTKINKCFSERSRTEHGVPQGLLFNIDLIDLFYECEESDIASYANKLFHWFQHNHLKANLGKFYLFLSSKTPTDVSIGDASLKTSTKETLLGILIDSELSFDQHVSFICSKASMF